MLSLVLVFVLDAPTYIYECRLLATTVSRDRVVFWCDRTPICRDAILVDGIAARFEVVCNSDAVLVSGFEDEEDSLPPP